MATPKKKHLIELMIEASVKWPDSAEYAAQDKKDNCVQFYKAGKPNYTNGFNQWMADNCIYMFSNGIPLPALCLNWHRTIVTREQYEKALADTSVTPTAQPSPEYCASVMRQMSDNTIEQLAADYHTKSAEAQRQQTIADEARKAADDALLALERAGELLCLIISIDTKPKQVEQQCSSAEWEVGDECIVTVSPDDCEWVGRECVLTKIDGNDRNLPYRVDGGSLGDFWVASIRRP